MTTDFEEYSPIQNEDGREVTIFISDEDYSRFLDAKDWLFITETDLFPVGTPITCNGCRYRKMLFGNRNAELRGCAVDGCFRYESGQKMRNRPFHECVDDDYI